MDREKKIKKSLEKFIPSRARLSMEAMFAVTQAERDAAQALLDALPKKEGSRDEEVAWMTEIWTAKFPSEADLEKSPIGRQTLAMLRANAPMSAQKPEPAATVAQAEPEPAPPAEPEAPPKLEPPPGPSDDLGERMEQERAAKRESEQLAGPVHKWVQAMPSKPDKSLRPLAPSDWNSDSNNSPIY